MRLRIRPPRPAIIPHEIGTQRARCVPRPWPARRRPIPPAQAGSEPPVVPHFPTWGRRRVAARRRAAPAREHRSSPCGPGESCTRTDGRTVVAPGACPRKRRPPAPPQAPRASAASSPRGRCPASAAATSRSSRVVGKSYPPASPSRNRNCRLTRTAGDQNRPSLGQGGEKECGTKKAPEGALATVHDVPRAGDMAAAELSRSPSRGRTGGTPCGRPCSDGSRPWRRRA